jgi:hypothetical protein
MGRCVSGLWGYAVPEKLSGYYAAQKADELAVRQSWVWKKNISDSLELIAEGINLANGAVADSEGGHRRNLLSPSPSPSGGGGHRVQDTKETQDIHRVLDPDIMMSLRVNSSVQQSQTAFNLKLPRTESLSAGSHPGRKLLSTYTQGKY